MIEADYENQAARIRFLLDLLVTHEQTDILIQFFEYVARHPFVANQDTN